VLALTNVRLNQGIMLLVILDISAASIVPNAFEVYPDGNDNDIRISNNCSVEANQCLQIDSRNVYKITDKDEH